MAKKLKVLKGWKVVRRGLRSANSPSNTKYRIGEWTRPLSGDGPLAVFKKQDDAENFCSVSDRAIPCYYIPAAKRRYFSLEFGCPITGVCAVYKTEPLGSVRGKDFADAVYLVRRHDD